MRRFVIYGMANNYRTIKVFHFCFHWSIDAISSAMQHMLCFMRILQFSTLWLQSGKFLALIVERQEEKLNENERAMSNLNNKNIIITMLDCCENSWGDFELCLAIDFRWVIGCTLAYNCEKCIYLLFSFHRHRYDQNVKFTLWTFVYELNFFVLRFEMQWIWFYICCL